MSQELTEDYIKKLVISHEKQMARVRKYNKAHAAELNEKSKENFKKLKADPEKYKAYLECKRKKYREQNPIPVLPVKVFV